VLEEIPGWQHIGDQAWQDTAVDNVSRMIRRDWNHPSIVLWGVRIKRIRRQPRLLHAHQRAWRTRSTIRARPAAYRYLYDSELLEDVFTMNDFGFPLRPAKPPAI